MPPLPPWKLRRTPGITSLQFAGSLSTPYARKSEAISSHSPNATLSPRANCTCPVFPIVSHRFSFCLLLRPSRLHPICAGDLPGDARIWEGLLLRHEVEHAPIHHKPVLRRRQPHCLALQVNAVGSKVNLQVAAHQERFRGGNGFGRAAQQGSPACQQLQVVKGLGVARAALLSSPCHRSRVALYSSCARGEELCGDGGCDHLDHRV